MAKKQTETETKVSEIGIEIETAAEDTSTNTEPKFEYNNKTYQSYVENGFEDKIPNQVSAPDKRMKEFLSRVDLSKGDIE
jgi:hypothetical protein